MLATHPALYSLPFLRYALRIQGLPAIMSNGLFIQSYPAPGVQVVPATYTVTKGGYAFIGSITIVIALIIGELRPDSWRWLPLGIVIYLGVACLALISFRSFRLDVRNDGISYANAFRKERFLAFNEISAVVLFTNRWTG